MTQVRLQKAIAEAGLMSRRKAEEAIREGRVSVNGGVVTEMGVQVDPERDDIRVDRKRLTQVEPKSYVILYKPAGCVTTASDPQGRKTVFDFLPRSRVRLYPVGRLDYDAEGLLILTNDGELAHRLQHPRYGVEKVYDVKVMGRPSEEAIRRLRTGIDLEEGRTAPARVSVLRLLPNAAWLRIVIHQGWNRQIKRMGEAVGHPVAKIKRVGYGPLTLGALTSGDSRPLTASEVEELHRLACLDREQTDNRGKERNSQS
jgi:23S rRNA pseudouridine2605 synthase